MKKCDAFTLLELMLTTVLASIVMLGLSMLVVGVHRSHLRQLRVGEQLQQAHAAFSIFERSVQNCSDPQVLALPFSAGSISMPMSNRTVRIYNAGSNLMYRDGAAATPITLVEGYTATFTSAAGPERYGMRLTNVETGNADLSAEIVRQLSQPRSSGGF